MIDDNCVKKFTLTITMHNHFFFSSNLYGMEKKKEVVYEIKWWESFGYIFSEENMQRCLGISTVSGKEYVSEISKVFSWKTDHYSFRSKRSWSLGTSPSYNLTMQIQAIHVEFESDCKVLVDSLHSIQHGFS